MGNTVSVKSPLLTMQTNTIEAINVILLHVAAVQLSSKLTLAWYLLRVLKTFVRLLVSLL